jgi:Uma2 family endonuclease
METVDRSVERKVILHNVRWETYERLLAKQESSSAPRFTYDRGELEIMSPSTEHEEYNRTVALLVEIFAVEAGLDVRNIGSMTFQREDVGRGFEPESCFYVQSEARVSGKA